MRPVEHFSPLALPAMLAIAIVSPFQQAPIFHTAPTTIVTGRVLDPSGQPIVAATLSIVGRGIGTTSKADGRYVLTVPRKPGSETVSLQATKPGFSTRRMSVYLNADTVRADIILTPATERVLELERAAQVAAPSTPIADHAVTAKVSVSPLTRAALASPAPSGNGAATRASMGQAVRRVVIGMRPPGREHGNTEAYDHIDENPFRSPRIAPLSTFSVDVDRASYSNVRRYLARGQLPPKDAVRIEELVNYFPYDDAAPGAGGSPLRVSTEVAAAPWNPRHDLVRIALRAREVDMRHAAPSNLVFLIDVSGSMNGPGRLPLVKEALALIVYQLREEDHVAIVVYAGNAGLVLPSTSGANKQRILAALDGLEAGGSTAGGAGIRLAYDVAQQGFIAGGTNRVILCTDGDFNVGQSSDGELVRLIEQRRKEGSYLTILGFGMGNYKDAKMEKLAGAGNGNYGYIDDLLEARKMLVSEMGGTLVTVAKDVKLQVEFNPDRVQAYRLIGYEDRLLRDEDFANDTKDAGDVGAGHTVTALYEVVPRGAPLDVALPDVAALRYQRPAQQRERSDELLHVAMRYKAPDGERSMLETVPVRAERRFASESMRFASAVAGFGMLLRESPLAGELTWARVLDLARGARGRDEDGYRGDFIRLAETAASLAKPERTGWRDR
ncbi:MAG: von Willebrand factor type A domain-containing protein [Gemmatimonadota bacterium]|nr:von Willebrand factor type A domain-containing protein [Gemmatimonadota bacterium]